MVRCKNGRVLYGLFSGTVIESQGKQFFLTVMIDITRQKELQGIVHDNELRLSNIIEGARLGTWEWNIRTGETVFNERWAEIIGYDLEELMPISIDTWTRLVHPDDAKKSNELLNDHFMGRSGYYDAECRMRHKNGSWVWVHDQGKVIEWDRDGKPLMMFGTHTDITEKKAMENRILEMSIRDPLTNVYNRRYIIETLEKDLAKYRRDTENNLFSVSILDIDYFKTINDTYGHLAGDYILTEFSKIVQESLRSYDLVGRYGGEEFFLIIYDCDKKQALSRINLLLDYVKDTVFSYDKNNMKITFSGGVADSREVDSERQTFNTLISLADKRLYMAKQAGRCRILDQDS